MCLILTLSVSHYAKYFKGLVLIGNGIEWLDRHVNEPDNMKWIALSGVWGETGSNLLSLSHEFWKLF